MLEVEHKAIFSLIVTSQQVFKATAIARLHKCINCILFFFKKIYIKSISYYIMNHLKDMVR